MSSSAAKSKSKAEDPLTQVKKTIKQIRVGPTKKLLEENLVAFVDKHKHKVVRFTHRERERGMLLVFTSS